MAGEHNFLDRMFLKDLNEFSGLSKGVLRCVCGHPMLEIVCPHCQETFFHCQQCGEMQKAMQYRGITFVEDVCTQDTKMVT